MDKIKIWLDENFKVVFDLEKFLKILLSIGVIVIPTASYTYLYWLLGEFGIRYFIYFNPADSLLVLYDLASTVMLLASFFGALILAFISPFANSPKWLKTKKGALVGWFILISIISLIFKLYYQFDTLEILYKALFLFILTSVLLFISPRIFFGLILILSTWFPIYHASQEARKIKKIQPTFNIETTNGIKFLQEEDSCKFFIKSTSNYTFIYDKCDSIVKATPNSLIKEISFTSKNKFTK